MVRGFLTMALFALLSFTVMSSVFTVFTQMKQGLVPAQTQESVTYMQATITVLLDDANSNLQYLRGTDPAAFDTAVKILTDDEQKVIQSLLQRKK